MKHATNSFAYAYTDWIIRLKYVVVIVCVAGIAALSTGATRLEFQQNYRMYFGPKNPQLVAFEKMEAVYTKNDNHLFIVHNVDGTVINETGLIAIRELTNEGWQIPHSNRVDSLANYQHSWAIEDDMIVEDLVPEGRESDPDTIARAKEVLMTEPAVKNFLVNGDLSSALVAVRVQLDEDDVLAVSECANYSYDLLDKMRAKYPELRFEVTGTGMLSNAFGKAPETDAKTVFPAMFALLIAFMFIFTRSITGTIATLGVIVLATAGALGVAGYIGYGLNPTSAAAPIVILTLAIADSIHILISMFKEMGKGSDKLQALRESIRINLQPVFLTSFTTMIGFLVMNFSDSPPFHELGNIVSIGVALAWVLSITFLPAMIAILPISPTHSTAFGQRMMVSVADFNIRHRKLLAVAIGGLVVFFTVSIVRMEITDIPHEYFDESIDFRTSTDFFDSQLGFYGFFISMESEGPGGINDPDYLKELDAFAQWLDAQPAVNYVSTFSNIAKRLNKNMHGDDPEYYRVPEERELAAQYLLLYEMSLPFGLDLNDRINVDKSATRLDAFFLDATLKDVEILGSESMDWLEKNAPHIRADDPTGPPIMFAHITRANIFSMIQGTIFGFALIAIIMVISLRSVTLGMLSLIPNIVPAATAFGIWAVFVGEAGFAISIVAGLSIGIIVDDTVHFLSKYSRARRELHLSSEEAVRYAFATVGQALLSTSFIVAGGFAVLMLSTFRVTAFMGALTSLTIVCALLADFFMLPAILLLLDHRKMEAPVQDPEPV